MFKEVKNFCDYLRPQWDEMDKDPDWRTDEYCGLYERHVYSMYQLYDTMIDLKEKPFMKVIVVEDDDIIPDCEEIEFDYEIDYDISFLYEPHSDQMGAMRVEIDDDLIQQLDTADRDELIYDELTHYRIRGIIQDIRMQIVWSESFRGNDKVLTKRLHHLLKRENMSNLGIAFRFINGTHYMEIYWDLEFFELIKPKDKKSYRELKELYKLKILEKKAVSIEGTHYPLTYFRPNTKVKNRVYKVNLFSCSEIQSNKPIEISIDQLGVP
jgi:hypothetical protein